MKWRLFLGQNGNHLRCCFYAVIIMDAFYARKVLMWYKSLHWFCCTCWGLSAAGEFWGAMGSWGDRSCAKPAEGAWAEQPQQWHREGEELQFPPWLTCCTVWVAMAGDHLLLQVGWRSFKKKKNQISPDLSRWLLKWKVCSITVNGQAFIILCY